MIHCNVFLLYSFLDFALILLRVSIHVHVGTEGIHMAVLAVYRREICAVLNRRSICMQPQHAQILNPHSVDAYC